MISSFVLAVVLSAPPAKPTVPEGRITIWAGDKIVHMKPDGTDLTPLALAAGVKVSPYTGLTPDHKFGLSIDASKSDYGSVWRNRLTVCSLHDANDVFTLDDYVAARTRLSADGKRVYFTGGRGPELAARVANVGGEGFVLDLAAKTVKPFPIPDGHGLVAVSADEKSLVTIRHELNGNRTTRRMYLTTPLGTKQVFRDNVGPHISMHHGPNSVLFHPSGKKLLAYTIEYAEIKPAPGGSGWAVSGEKPTEFVIVDTTTGAVTKVKDIPGNGSLAGIAWSPDGTRIAYAWYDPTKAEVVGTTPPGAFPPSPIRSFEYKVYVADADGRNPKPIHKVNGERMGLFTWN